VTALVEVSGLTVDYRRNGAWDTVIRDVDLAIAPGEALGLAGESGCGKSTLASLLLGERRSERRVSAGQVRLGGIDLFQARPNALRALRRRRLALVPQNGGTSLTPTMRLGRLFAETLGQDTAGAEQALARVGLPDPTAALRRYPHQFSGGQQQRIALALAICREPDLLILDEPTTGQDALTRRGIVELLASLRASTRMAMLYVSHDLATLSEVCDRIAIMYAGEIVEIGAASIVLQAPRHPYTKALLASVPRLDRAPDPDAILTGALDRRLLPEGCRFAPRCPHAESACHADRPLLETIGRDHAIACRRWSEFEIARPEAQRVSA
jgi:peptide/nickel transport system ATP-binding protein